MSVKTAVKPTPAKVAAKAAPKTAEKPTEKVADTTAALDWSNLPPAQAVTYVRVTARPSVEETTPEVIKSRVREAFEATTASGAPKFKTQMCGTAEHAEAFLKFAKRYATHVSGTLRGKVLTDAEINDLIQRHELPPGVPSGTVVSFAVKARETRQRKDKAE